MRWAPEYEKSIGGEDEKGEKGKKHSSHHLLHLINIYGDQSWYKLSKTRWFIHLLNIQWKSIGMESLGKTG